MRALAGGFIARLVTILRAFPRGEPTKKKFVGEMMAWSGKVGEYPHGDPELHHVAGTLFAEGETGNGIAAGTFHGIDRLISW